MTRKEGYIPTQMAAIEKGAKSVEAGRECPPILRDEGGMTETWATFELMLRPLDECLFIHMYIHFDT